MDDGSIAKEMLFAYVAALQSFLRDNHCVYFVKSFKHGLNTLRKEKRKGKR